MCNDYRYKAKIWCVLRSSLQEERSINFNDVFRALFSYLMIFYLTTVKLLSVFFFIFLFFNKVSSFINDNCIVCRKLVHVDNTNILILNWNNMSSKVLLEVCKFLLALNLGPYLSKILAMVLKSEENIDTTFQNVLFHKLVSTKNFRNRNKCRS